MEVSRRSFFSFIVGASGAAAAAGLPAEATTAVPLAKGPPTIGPLREGWDYATVRWFNRVRGIGFLSRGDGKEEIFVHICCVRASNMQDLTVGQKLHVHFTNARHGYLHATRLYPA